MVKAALKADAAQPQSCLRTYGSASKAPRKSQFSLTPIIKADDACGSVMIVRER